MTFWQMLWRIELRAVAALVICACLMALYGIVDELRIMAKGVSPLISPIDGAWLVFAYTIAIGVLPVIFYGAPIYAFLRHRGLASWLAVALIGIAPGVVMFLVGARDLKSDLTGWFVICGIGVAVLTHLLSSHGRLQLANQG